VFTARYGLGLKIKHYITPLEGEPNFNQFASVIAMPLVFSAAGLNVSLITCMNSILRSIELQPRRSDSQ